MAKNAVVLLSGGLASATTLGILLQSGYEIHTLSFDYNQPQRRELESAKALANYYGIIFQQTRTLDLHNPGIHQNDDPSRAQTSIMESLAFPGAPAYVPAQNAIFLSYALAYAENRGIDDIFLGLNVIDHSGTFTYRPEFLRAFELVANLSTRAAIQEHRSFHFYAPLLHMSKAAIIKSGTELAVPYELTWNCFHSEETACGTCKGCLLRLNGFAEAGRQDPIGYNPGLRQWP